MIKADPNSWLAFICFSLLFGSIIYLAYLSTRDSDEKVDKD
jgi:hypothetical protein